MADSAETKSRRCVYVGGLAPEVNESVVRAACVPFGELIEVQVPLDHLTGKNRGFAFVQFALEEDCQDAIDNLDNSELYGRVIRVNLSRGQRKDQAVWQEDADAWFKSLKEKGEAGDDDADADAGTGGGSSSNSSGSASAASKK